MKHIKFFKTKAERDAAEVERPYVIYIKDVNKLEFADEYPIRTDSNPELMSVLYNLGWAANSDYMTEEECEAVTDAMLASSVTSNTSAFTSIISFNELVYFKNISVIPDYCFYNCQNLTAIQFPKGIVEIGANAFRKCISLTSIDLPTNLQTLGDGAFMTVPLELAVVPASCSNIGSNVFYIDNNMTQGTKRIDFSLTNITKTPNATYRNNPIWVKLPSTCTGSNGGNIMGNTAYAHKGWIWFNCTSPFTGTFGDVIGLKKTVRVYVPDDYVDVWKASSVKYTNTSGMTWAAYSSHIYPHSQWETDKNNGVIDV